MSYTSGPWKASLAVVSNAPSVYVVTNGKWGAPNIAQVAEEANARLIAAAPEMLKALQAAEEYLMQQHGDCVDPSCDCEGNDEGKEVVTTIRNAILKAKGK